SVDDMEGPEWNYAALSPKKRELGERLVKRLRSRFAPNGFLHFGQGKGYPGEPLPRWALGIFWRTDGQPLWHQDALIADTTKGGAATVATAQAFGERLAGGRRLPPSLLITAYEDVPKLLQAEAMLPPNVDPLQADLALPDERARLARLLSAGLSTPTGVVLPLKAAQDAAGAIGWSSGPGAVKGGRPYPLPGGSALGVARPL